jgi:hypothetical protein
MKSTARKICALTFAVVFIAILGNYAANMPKKSNVTAFSTPIAYCNSNIM